MPFPRCSLRSEGSSVVEINHACSLPPPKIKYSEASQSPISQSALTQAEYSQSAQGGTWTFQSSGLIADEEDTIETEEEKVSEPYGDGACASGRAATMNVSSYSAQEQRVHLCRAPDVSYSDIDHRRRTYSVHCEEEIEMERPVEAQENPLYSKRSVFQIFSQDKEGNATTTNVITAAGDQVTIK